MKTFKEYVAARDLKEDTIPQISDEIADVGNALAQKNPKIVPGLTKVKDIKNALSTDQGIKKLVEKDPTAAGGVGAYLGGPQAAKELGVKI